MPTPPLPDEFLGRLHQQFGQSSTRIVDAFNEGQVQSVRLNSRKKCSLELGDQIPWSKTGYYLDERPSYALDPLFHAGAYYPQEASSMALEVAVEEVKQRRQVNKVLDLCAAPGGKSTHLLNLLEEASVLMSNEIVPKRFSILYENLIKWGSPNFIASNHRPEKLARLGPVFDLIVVDAPCSGEGLFRKQPDWRLDWSIENCELCANRQSKILQSAISMLRDEGFLIYSTCTLNPDENEHQIERLLSQGFEEITLSTLEANNFHRLKHGYLATPDAVNGEPFYISLLHYSNLQANIRQTKERLKYERCSIDEISGACYALKDTLFQLNDMQLELSSLMHKAHISHRLPPVGQRKKSIFIPDHFVAMKNDVSTIYPVHDFSLQDALSYLRHKEVEHKPKEKGWHLISFNQVQIGLAKYDGRRLINKYPIKWRLRS